MPKSRVRPIAGAVALTVLLSVAAEARPVVVPFDFSRHEIGLDVSVHGSPLYMFLDTGVSPSAIDTARARSLGLKIDFAGGGEASGQGNARHMIVYPTSIDEVVIGGSRFGPIEALAADHTAINRAYGRKVDGTLGHSFLSGRVVLIDYRAKTVTITDREEDVASKLARCRSTWRTRLKSFKGDTIPIVDLTIGSVRLPVSIDTGSDGVLELFASAMRIPAVTSALIQMGTTRQTGARGGYSARVYRLNAPIRLGPFVLPPAQRVSLSSEEGGVRTRMANVGNRLLASMQVKLLLNYRNSRMAFFGNCAK